MEQRKLFSTNRFVKLHCILLKVFLNHNTACFVGSHCTFIRAQSLVSLVINILSMTQCNATINMMCGYCSAAIMGGFALCVAITGNAYLMSSRIILQSVANLPLFVILHMFIILMGMCACVCKCVMCVCVMYVE